MSVSACRKREGEVYELPVSHENKRNRPNEVTSFKRDVENWLKKSQRPVFVEVIKEIARDAIEKAEEKDSFPLFKVINEEWFAGNTLEKRDSSLTLSRDNSTTFLRAFKKKVKKLEASYKKVIHPLFFKIYRSILEDRKIADKWVEEKSIGDLYTPPRCHRKVTETDSTLYFRTVKDLESAGKRRIVEAIKSIDGYEFQSPIVAPLKSTVATVHFFMREFFSTWVVHTHKKNLVLGKTFPLFPRALPLEGEVVSNASNTTISSIGSTKDIFLIKVLPFLDKKEISHVSQLSKKIHKLMNDNFSLIYRATFRAQKESEWRALNENIQRHFPYPELLEFDPVFPRTLVEQLGQLQITPNLGVFESEKQAIHSLIHTTTDRFMNEILDIYISKFPDGGKHFSLALEWLQENKWGMSEDEWQSGSFSLYPQRKNQVVIFPKLQLDAIPNLRSIEIRSTNIPYVPPLQYRELKVLILQNNAVWSGLGLDLPNLERLDLSKNALKKIPNMEKVPKLTYLDVSKNPIEKIEEDHFFPPTLQIANLAHLQIKRLPLSLVHTDLKHLDIRQSPIRSCPKRLLKKKIELTILSLSTVRIFAILSKNEIRRRSTKSHTFECEKNLFHHTLNQIIRYHILSKGLFEPYPEQEE